MKEVTLYGRVYVPALSSGKLQIQPIVAFGQGLKRGQLLLTAYLFIEAKATRGRTYRTDILRQYLPRATSKEEQHRMLSAMCEAVALQYECDYVLVQPINPK